MMAIRLKWPAHWSEWLLCVGLLLSICFMADYCLWCIDQITLDGEGSFLVGVARDFRAMTGWW